VKSPARTFDSPYWSWKKVLRKLAMPTNPPNVKL